MSLKGLSYAYFNGLTESHVTKLLKAFERFKAPIESVCVSDLTEEVLTSLAVWELSNEAVQSVVQWARQSNDGRLHLQITLAHQFTKVAKALAGAAQMARQYPRCLEAHEDATGMCEAG